MILRLELYFYYCIQFIFWFAETMDWFQIDKIFTYVYLAIVLLIIYFSLLAEIPFWDEFGVRFNFIAVDYLIYTYEVISNINESYPLPLIIFVLVALIVLTFVSFKKERYSEIHFLTKDRFHND